MDKNTLQATATDVTLVLGAESYIRRNNYPSDPSSRECLRDFVDLILNSEKMYLTLPGSEDQGTPVLIQRLGGILSRLPEAAIDLTPETELKVRDGLVNLAADRGRDWLRRWLEFQLFNPIVTEGHRTRVGGRMISEGGRQIWEIHRQLIMAQVPQNIYPLVPASKIPKYLEEEIRTFSSTDEFLLCYSFDVYRRGWQYLGRVSAADVQATYFPHELRNNALDVGTDAWRTLHLNEELLWSWGGYIVELLDEPEYENQRSPERIADYVLAIREAMNKIGCPKWLDVAIVEEDGSLRSPEVIKGFSKLIEETAHIAGLPLLRMRKHSDRTIDLVTTGIEFFSHVSDSLPIIFSGLRFLLAVLKRVNPDAVGKIENKRRKAINLFFKGKFGYRGLQPIQKAKSRPGSN